MTGIAHLRKRYQWRARSHICGFGAWTNPPRGSHIWLVDASKLEFAANGRRANGRRLRTYLDFCEGGRTWQSRRARRRHGTGVGRHAEIVARDTDWRRSARHTYAELVLTVVSGSPVGRHAKQGFTYTKVVLEALLVSLQLLWRGRYGLLDYPLTAVL